VAWYLSRRWSEIDNFVLYSHDIQRKLLFQMLADSANTVFGRQYDFHKMKNTQDYKSAVPIHTYEDLKPYIERNMHGEQQILWHSDIEWFAKSSGTSSDKSKFIPVSKESLNEIHYKGGQDLLTFYFRNNPESKLFTGKSLIMGGSYSSLPRGDKIRVGDVSAVMMQNMSMLGNLFRAPDLEIALMNEWEEKIEKIVHTTINENITQIAGVPSWTLVLLKRILTITGKSNILDIWPNLELYTHGGVNFMPYQSQFDNILGRNKIKYYQVYNASEGFFSIQDRNNSDDMLLMLDYGIYYEFMPIEELAKGSPRTLSLYEIELNKNYAPIITTNSGLYRYIIGDTIRFTSTSPYRIQVTGRTKAYINTFGEELIVDNTDKALTQACKQTNAVLHEYTVAPIYFTDKDNGAHEWIIEFEKEPKNLIQFTEILDTQLQAINSDYEAKRYKNIALRLPIIHNAPKGTFYTWMKSRGKVGGQNKVPRLSNERTYINDILKLIL